MHTLNKPGLDLSAPISPASGKLNPSGRCDWYGWYGRHDASPAIPLHNSYTLPQCLDVAII